MNNICAVYKDTHEWTHTANNIDIGLRIHNTKMITSTIEKRPQCFVVTKIECSVQKYVNYEQREFQYADEYGLNEVKTKEKSEELIFKRTKKIKKLSQTILRTRKIPEFDHYIEIPYK